MLTGSMIDTCDRKTAKEYKEYLDAVSYDHINNEIERTHAITAHQSSNPKLLTMSVRQ